MLPKNWISSRQTRCLDGKFSHMEENAKFVDEQIRKLQTSVDEGKSKVSECRKQTLYLETYSRRENLKFEGIPELAESPGQ